MKRKLLLPAIAWVASSVLVCAVLADHTEKSRKDSMYSEKRTETSQSHQIMKWSQAQGATVQDRQGNNVGTIHDIIAEPNNGRLAFAVLSLSGPEFAGKFTAVPWRLMRQESPNTFVLQADKDKLLTARTFTRDQWPDFSQPDVANSYYTHYGLTYERPGVGGRVMLPEGVEYGTEWQYAKESAFPRPQPDGHSTFPYLNRENKDR